MSSLRRHRVCRFSGGVDLRSAQNLVVTIRAGLDRTTDILSWRYLSVDPLTRQQTDELTAGFLPPNVNPPEGDGSVSFTVRSRAALANRTQLCNRASIIFDTNAPIVTPAWCNTVRDPLPGACAGDCDGNGSVRIAELFTGVAMALNRLPIDACPALDADTSGRIAINELVAALSAALTGCGKQPAASRRGRPVPDAMMGG